MKRLLTVPLALMLVGYLASSCTSSSNDNKAQNDSIAAETARLDSIRQDSIARRNFITPDLAFNDLHGDVKHVKLNQAILPAVIVRFLLTMKVANGQMSLYGMNTIRKICPKQRSIEK